jgi:hypothetical protein
MAETNDSDKLPQEFPHIFGMVLFGIVPEVSYDDLVYLSRIVKIKQRTQLYGPLADSLRKIQWAKLAGIGANAIEKEVTGQIDDKTVLCDPVGQVQHTKAVIDFVTHSKAALDSIAVFLNAYFSLGEGGGNRDFRKRNFREQAANADVVIGKHVKHIKAWIDNLIAIRDEWIHRDSPLITLTGPLTEVGALPIPKRVRSRFEEIDTPLTRQFYWSTPEFIEFHFANLVSLFNTIIERCIQLEAASLSELPARPKPGEKPIVAVPFRVSKDMTARKLRLGQRTQMFLGGGSLKLD